MRDGRFLSIYDLMEKARDLAISTLAVDADRAAETARALLGIPVPEAAARD